MDLLHIVVPCYNEAQNIEKFYVRVSEILLERKQEYVITFVDDGSTDNSLLEIKRLYRKYKNIAYLSFSRNFGKEAAMLAGMEQARNAELVAIMDVDLQDPPDLLLDMLTMLEKNPEVDCVAAKKVNRKGEPRIKSFFQNGFIK